MTQVSITIYPEIDGEEREFEATARVSLGSPARGIGGPPEFSSPAEPPEVEWVSVTGEGMTLKADVFEAWLAERGCSLALSAYDDAAIEKAIEEYDDGPDADDYYSARGMVW